VIFFGQFSLNFGLPVLAQLSFENKQTWRTVEGKMANQSGFSGSTQASPLLSSTRKLYNKDKGSLTNSYETPKSYGATTKPVRNEVETKIIGHVVESVDTLQGLSIKYGVPVC